MADSRRINANIREEESRLPVEEQSTLPLSSMIISSEFWPQLKEEKMELPAVVSKAMEDYTHRFEKLKVLPLVLSWFCCRTRYYVEHQVFTQCSDKSLFRFFSS